jgi:hypothetical protein
LSKSVIGTIMLLAVVIVATPAGAQEAFFGVWKVAGAEEAPWAEKFPNRSADVIPAIRGGIIEIAKDRFSSPICACGECKHPEYKVDREPRLGLFEGALYDPGHGITNTNELAGRYGFYDDSIDELVVLGCGQPEFQINKAGVMVFAFWNVIYTAERVK